MGWGGAAGVAVSYLLEVASSDRETSGIDPKAFDWVGRTALLLAAVGALVVLWAAVVLVRAVPDLWERRRVTGEIVRDRRRTQVFSSGDDPKYWYYLAVDDGSGTRVAAWRVRRELWEGRRQGETVTAEITPRLAYVRSVDVEPAPRTPVTSG